MITAKEAYIAVKNFVKDKEPFKCYLCDNGYIFAFGNGASMNNLLFVKSNGGIRPCIPKRDLPTIIKEKEVSEYRNGTI